MKYLPLLLPVLCSLVFSGCEGDLRIDSVLLEGTAKFADGSIIRNRPIETVVTVQGFGRIDRESAYDGHYNFITGCGTEGVINGVTARVPMVDANGRFVDLFTLQEAEWSGEGCANYVTPNMPEATIPTRLSRIDNLVVFRIDAYMTADVTVCRSYCESYHRNVCTTQCTTSPDQSSCIQTCIEESFEGCYQTCTSSKQVVATTTLYADELTQNQLSQEEPASAEFGPVKFDLIFNALK